jgi:hypothetical protein
MSNAKPTTKAEQREEDSRRRRTARALQRARLQLEKMRQALQRDLSQAAMLHEALQAWVDGGEFPEIASRYAVLHAGVKYYGNLVHMSAAEDREHKRVFDALCEIAGPSMDYTELNEQLDDVMDAPLIVACGFWRERTRKTLEAASAAATAAAEARFVNALELASQASSTLPGTPQLHLVIERGAHESIDA